MQPLLTEEELAKTRKKVEEFARPGGVGQTLQQKLLERAASTDNWVNCLAFSHFSFILQIKTIIFRSVCCTEYKSHLYFWFHIYTH